MNGENRYFLDTNALVSFANGEESLGRLVLNADYVATSVICKLEFLSWSGLPADVRDIFLRFLDQIDLIGLNALDSALHDRVIEMRTKNVNIKLPDAIVMASALATQSILLTRDRQLLNSGLCQAQSF